MGKKLIRWLYKEVNNYTESTNKDLIDDLFFYLEKFIIQNKELRVTETKEDLRIHFYLFIYNGSIIDNNYINDDRFNIQYSDEIVDLFIKMKDISNNYGSTIFNQKTDNSDCLLEFLNNYLIIEDTYYEEEDDIIIQEDVY
tara:strand:- start:200 stop:622 length:423 start_codon:yes stop_codon:yes gene_type:complete